jgi:isoaspartyl peptidase/L-asparaginase-like protein (Ntn-hydrolase superfamily)
MAAACTTSGLAWKLAGRVGDSPLIGHGLYCDDEAGGAAATGVGEEVIRVCGSYQVVEFMRQGVDPDVAVRRVLQRILRRKGAAAEPNFVGLVALRSDGEIGYASTTPGFRVAVSRMGRHELVDAPSLLGRKKATAAVGGSS